MERMKGFVEQPVQVEHVGATPGEQRLDHPDRRIAAHDFAPLEVDEDCRPLRRILRLLRQLGRQRGDAVADGIDRP